jgi:hypothetical protein
MGAVPISLPAVHLSRSASWDFFSCSGGYFVYLCFLKADLLLLGGVISFVVA